MATKWSELTPEEQQQAIKAYREDRQDYVIQLSAEELSNVEIVLGDAFDYTHWSDDPVMLRAFDQVREGLKLK